MKKGPDPFSRTDLLGRWRLVSYSASSQEGKTVYPMGREALGVLEYSADGRVSVHIMGEGYFAYYGRYSVDEGASTVTHHLEMASDPGFVGKSNLRRARLQGSTLTLSGDMVLEGEPHTIRVIWRRESPG